MAPLPQHTEYGSVTATINTVQAGSLEDSDEIIVPPPGPPMTGVWIVVAVFILLGMLFTVVVGWIWCVSAMEPEYREESSVREMRRRWKRKRGGFGEWYRRRRLAHSAPELILSCRPSNYSHNSHIWKRSRDAREYTRSISVPRRKEYGTMGHSSLESLPTGGRGKRDWSVLEKVPLLVPQRNGRKWERRAQMYFERRKGLTWARKGVGLLDVVTEEVGTPEKE